MAIRPVLAGAGYTLVTIPHWRAVQTAVGICVGRIGHPFQTASSNCALHKRRDFILNQIERLQ